MLFFDLSDVTCSLSSDWTPDVRVAVEVLRRVLDHPLTHVVILNRKNGDRLEATPAQRDDQGISILENFRIPPMLLDSELNVTDLVLSSLEINSNMCFRRNKSGSEKKV